MTWSQEFTAYTRTWFQRRESAFGVRREEILQALKGCGEDEAQLVRYYYATMPLTDVGDYPPSFFVETARQALAARRDFLWCQALPEHLFMRNVASPRVNTESLSDCRELFRKKLEPRVAGLSLPEAILEVNRWCAQEATYRSTDGRTASPLQVYTCGYGRCGEESTFLTTALRSVGIAARQVYAPWWSHCDDNHAWVEAFDGDRWRYLGACEPEPVLDRGWFTHAAARAVMIHARSFVQGTLEEIAFLFPDVNPLDLSLREGVAYENLTARYGPTKELTVTLTEPEGTPLPGGWVSLAVLNMAAPQEVARARTDTHGRARFRVGKGSLLLTAWDGTHPGLVGEVFASPEETAVSLTLGKTLPSVGEVDFEAPADAGLTVPPLDPPQKESRRQVLEQAAAHREKKASQAPQIASPAGEKGRLWASLTEKDRAVPVREDVLEDGLQAFSWEASLPQQAFQEGMLSPRVGLEELTPWRQLLQGALSEAQKTQARQDPRSLWAWVEDHVSWDPSCYGALWGTPLGMLQTGAGTQQGRAVLFCAACRAVGVPAKLVDGQPWFWQAGTFHPLWSEEPTGLLTLEAPAGQTGFAGQTYCLSRMDAQGFCPVTTGDVPGGGQQTWPVSPGRFRLWTTSRMPGGNQLARWETFSLDQEESVEKALVFREGRVEDLLERCPLPEFLLKDQQGSVVSGKELLGRSPRTVLCFLEAGREPTEHILNELRESAVAFQKTGCPLCLVLEELSQREDPTLGKTLQALPWAQLFTSEFAETVSSLARRMYLDPDQLPLVLLASREGEGLYGCSGYNVGTAGLLLRLLGEEAL